MKNGFFAEALLCVSVSCTWERNIGSRMTQQMPRCQRYVSYRYSLNLKLFVYTLPISIVFFYFRIKLEVDDHL
jgi:hypothetical protein